VNNPKYFFGKAQQRDMVEWSVATAASFLHHAGDQKNQHPAK
jgi:hypothetical protein